MDSSTIIKFLAGLLPVAPITGELLDEELQMQQADSNEESNGADSRYADYKGPTMEEEIAAHTSNRPAIKGVKGNFNVQVGSRFNPKAGVYAVDRYDGNLTGNIEVTKNNVDTSRPGSYTVTYRVENSRNYWSTYTRVVDVVNGSGDRVPLVPPTEAQLAGEDEAEESEANSAITFLGLEDQTIEQGSEFDPKEDVQVIDVDGSDITYRLHISGEVDTETPGEYTIAYATFDHFGDPHAKARRITVE
ncbi:immunoglobulin-like domain-containing protein [Salinicoccus siamensis]|uniref:Immunoglobulin-like domain-containing protein n=1 Tax=Salinicoccus siamensis TaxID=381830 RepID=A0ABV5Z9A8_9STAP